MAETTGIAWCDHTWSPWIGCTKVSPGCDHCYAEALDARHRYGGATHWGAGVPRYRTKSWSQPIAWNKKAAKAGERRTVFPSLCDPFDLDVDQQWCEDFFDLIGVTQNLTWLLLTKRIGLVNKIARQSRNYPNVWLGASVVNQEEADRDIPKLLATPAAKRFVSYEPALGSVGWSPFFAANDLHRIDGGLRLDWIIVGGASSPGGAKARPFNLAWARSTVGLCGAAGVPCFVKQLGSCVHVRNDEEWDNWPHFDHGAVEHDVHGFSEEYQGALCRPRLRDRAGADPAEWPEDLRVQEFPA